MQSLKNFFKDHEEILLETILSDDITSFNSYIKCLNHFTFYFIHNVINLNPRPKNFKYFIGKLYDIDKTNLFHEKRFLYDNDVFDVISVKKIDQDFFIEILRYDLEYAKKIIENGHVLTSELFELVEYSQFDCSFEEIKFLVENGAQLYNHNRNILEAYIINRYEKNRINYDIIQYFLDCGVSVTEDVKNNIIYCAFVHVKKLEKLEELNTDEIHEYIDLKMNKIHIELNDFIYNPEGIGATMSIMRNELGFMKNEFGFMKNELKKIKDENEKLRNEIEKLKNEN